MQKSAVIFFTLIICLCFSVTSFAQKKDSSAVTSKTFTIQNDSLPKHKHEKKSGFIDTTFGKFNPHVAIVRSAMIPGWGQAYNKQYWKIPLIYGALGTTAAIFFYNLKTYNQLRQAYIVLETDTSANAIYQIPAYLRYISAPAIQSYRNEFRQNLDYSVMFFLIFWGVNVIDATVSAHLKSFDVGNDLSLEIKPTYNPSSNTSGLSLVLNLGTNNPKPLTSLP